MAPAQPERSRRLLGSLVAVGAVVLAIVLLIVVNGRSPSGGRHTGAGTGPTGQRSQGPGSSPTGRTASPPPASSGQPTGQATPAPGTSAGDVSGGKQGGTTSHEPLTVLNNSLITGLADEAAQTFQQNGWQVRLVGNVKGRFWYTTVYYAPGYQEQAQELQRQFPRIVRVLPRYDGLPGGGNVTVVVTKDWVG